MPLQEQASLWSDTTIKTLDVRSGTLPAWRCDEAKRD